MTKQEFEARYGKEVSDKMFDTINDLYMGADDMDKDTFVRDYKKHEESLLLNIYFNKAQAQGKVISNLKQENAFLIDTIIKKGSEDLDDDLLTIAETHIGKKNTILRKIALNIELTDDDLAYVKGNLK